MAEIEFTRRGTPLWAVVLVLLVIAAALYVVFGRGDGQPATAAADSATAAPGAGTPGAAVPGASGPAAAAPSAPATPHAAFAVWIDSAGAPEEGATAVAAYTGSGLRKLAGALEEKVPMAGVQHLLVRAMADTVLMAESTPRKQLDATQAAFFAVAFALRDKPAGRLIEPAAQRIQLTRSLAEQRADVKHFFEVAREALRDPSKGPPLPPGAGPAPTPKS